jgi:hypothetical protein
VNQVGLININDEGSSNPQMEQKIINEWSYGRQLGRILEVLEEMISQQKASKSKPIKDLEQMALDIKELKGSRLLVTGVDSDSP